MSPDARAPSTRGIFALSLHRTDLLRIYVRSSDTIEPVDVTEARLPDGNDDDSRQNWSGREHVGPSGPGLYRVLVLRPRLHDEIRDPADSEYGDGAEQLPRVGADAQRCSRPGTATPVLSAPLTN
jgi:hypothetical protein